MPLKDVTCTSDLGTFDGEKHGLMPLETLTKEERELSEALRRLGREFEIDRPLGFG